MTSGEGRALPTDRLSVSGRRLSTLHSHRGAGARPVAPDAAAQLTFRAEGIEVDPRSRGGERVGEAAHPRLTWRRIWRVVNAAAIPLIGIWLATHLVPHGVDDLGYYRSRELYGVVWNTRPEAFIYSPAFAQVLWPFTSNLSYPAFHVALEVVQVAAVVWLLGPALALGFLLIPIFGDYYIVNGNITPLLAVALTQRWWFAMLLTKVLPGVTILWLVGRRDWRGLALSLGITAAIAGVSFVLWPDAWFGWADALLRATSSPIKGWPIPLWLRFPAAAAIALYAGRTNRAWLLPVAAMLSLGDVWWSSAVWLVACLRLGRRELVDPGRVRRRVQRIDEEDVAVQLVDRAAVVEQVA